MKNILIIIAFLLPISVSAQLLRAYGVVEIGATFPTSTVTGAKFAYRTTDSSYYRWVSGNTWVKILESSIDPDTLYLKQLSGTTALVDGDTIDISTYLIHSDTSSMLTPYIKLAGYGLSKLVTGTLQVDTSLISTKVYTNRFLLKTDTASMLLNYPSTAGYGIIDGGKTWRADTTSPSGLATRLFAKTLPTSILTGQVAYSNGSNLVGSANHFWDNTNVRLGIGTNTPSFPIDILGNTNGTFYARVYNPNTGSAGAAGYIAATEAGNGNQAGIGKVSSGYTTYRTIVARDFFIYNGVTAGDISILNDFTTGKIKFSTSASSTAQMTLAATGNLLLGTTSDVATSILTTRSTTKSSSPFPLHTLAESDAITGVQGNFDYETTQNGLRWYNGTRKAYALESTFARGTATYVPFFDANGQFTQDGNIYWNNTSKYLGLGSTAPTFPFTSDWKLSIVGTGASATGRTGFVVKNTQANSGAVLALLNNANEYLAVQITGASFVTGAAASMGTNNLDFKIITNGETATGGNAKVIFQPGGYSQSPIMTANRVGLILGSTSSPSRLLHVEGEARISDLTTDTPTRIVGADADGDLGALALSGLSISSGTLTAASIYNLLPIGNVSVPTNTNTLTFNGSSLTLQNQGGFNALTIKGNTDYEGTFIQNQKTFTYFTQLDKGNPLLPGHYRLKHQITHTALGGGDHVINVTSLDTATVVVRNFQGSFFGTESFAQQFSVSSNISGIPGFKILKTDVGTTGNLFEIQSTTGTAFLNSVRADGMVGWSRYGTGVMEASDLSKTQSAYIAGFATDGTVLDYPISGLGNGIYTGSGTLANHTTRALIPETGNLLFSQVYNTTDSAYIQVINNLDGNREVRGGLTDTITSGFSKFRFYQDGDNEVMGWEALTDDGIGTTTVKAEGGNLSFYADAAGSLELRGAEIRLNNGEVLMNQYGQDNMKASDLGQTSSNFVAGYSTTGRVVDFQIRRDTFTEDASVTITNTSLGDCSELFITTSMTNLAAAHLVVSLPIPSASNHNKRVSVWNRRKDAGLFIPVIDVTGGGSTLYYTANTMTTAPSDQATLTLDGTTWHHFGKTYVFNCVKINSTDYRWVLDQR